MTARGALVGTPYFMAPEQIRGEELDARTDIYSLGALHVSAAHRRAPVPGSTPVAVLTQHLTEPLDAPSERRPDLGIPPRSTADHRRRWPRRARTLPERRRAQRRRSRIAPHASQPRDRALPTGGAIGSRRATGPSPHRAKPLRREDSTTWERALKRAALDGAVALPLRSRAVAGRFAFIRHQTSAAPAWKSRPSRTTRAEQAN